MLRIILSMIFIVKPPIFGKGVKLVGPGQLLPLKKYEIGRSTACWEESLFYGTMKNLPNSGSDALNVRYGVTHPITALESVNSYMRFL
jgi:hypothetical protein